VALAPNPLVTVPPSWRERIREDIPGLRAFVVELGLAGAPAHVDQIDRLLNWVGLTEGRLRDELLSLRGSIEHQVAAREFYYVDPDLVEAYKNPLAGWGCVPEKFRHTKPDIEEASKCLALGRDTACVFHLMRVAELGLRRLANRLGVKKIGNKPVEREQWQKVLTAIHTKAQALRGVTPTARTDKRLTYYSELAFDLQGAKDAWRNHMAHVRTPPRPKPPASLAYEHVRRMMCKLADGAP
jgi:hypothetical protein